MSQYGSISTAALESKITSVEECHLKWILLADSTLISDYKLVKFVFMSRTMLLSVAGGS